MEQTEQNENVIRNIQNEHMISSPVQKPNRYSRSIDYSSFIGDCKYNQKSNDVYEYERIKRAGDDVMNR